MGLPLCAMCVLQLCVGTVRLYVRTYVCTLDELIVRGLGVLSQFCEVLTQRRRRPGVRSRVLCWIACTADTIVI